MDEEFSLPQPFTGGSTALALPAPSVGSGLESMSSMSPMESMMEIFMEIRDGINTLVDLFQAQILQLIVLRWIIVVFLSRAPMFHSLKGLRMLPTTQAILI